MSKTVKGAAKGRDRTLSEVPLTPSVGVITYDSEGHCTSANETAAELVGVSRQVLLRQDLRDSSFFGDSGLLVFAEAVLGGASHSAAVWLDTAQGGRRPLNVHLEPVTMAGELMLLTVLTDTSDLIRLESALRGSRERFRELVDETPDLLFSFDAKGTLTAANKSLAAAARCGLPELVGKRLGEVGLPAKVATQWERARRRVLWTGVPLEFETLARWSDERPRVLDVALCPIMADGAAAIGTRGSARDITDRKEAEATLRESEEHYRALFERSLDCVYVHDLEGRFLDANAAVLDLLGYEPDELRSLTFASLLDDAQMTNAAEVLRELLETGSQSGIARYRLRCKSGRYVDVETKASLIFREGKPCAVQGIARDVTERLVAEERLRQAQKMEALGQLAGGIAHDFNNLLTAIIGYSDLALETMDPADPNRSLIQEIRQVGERASGLTRQILAFSRQQKLEPQVVSLNEVLRRLEPLLQRTLGEDIDLSFHLAAEPSQVEVDPSQMEQVVMNLVVNARDAMARGGRLTLETANVELDSTYARTHMEVNPGPHVMLAVSDTGCGMIKETAARVFEPFFTTKDSGKGTGLGLSTVFGIVKQSGGNISLYSELGIGSTFRVYLPCAASTAPETPEAVATGGLARGTGTILVVEDDASIRGLVTRVLTRAGYEVVQASSAEEAMSAVGRASVPPDLLLTDLVLPGGEGGYDLAQSLLARYPTLPVTYMSGYSVKSGVGTGRPEASAEDYLEKPFTPDLLLQHVQRALDTERPRKC